MKKPAANKPVDSWMSRFRVTAAKERQREATKRDVENLKTQKKKTTVFASSSGQLFSKFPSCVWCREKLSI
jgi:hypothetical protein